MCSSNFVNAQLTGGIKTGINLSNFIGSDAGDSEMIIGYQAGGFLQIDFSDKFYFQPELFMSMVGSKDSESGTDPDFGDYKIDARLQLTYRTAPILIGYRVNDRSSLHAGAQVSILTAAKAKYDIETDFINTSGSESAKEQFKEISGDRLRDKFWIRG